MKKALMIAAIVLTSAGAAAAGSSQSNAQNGVHPNKHHSSDAATKSMNHGTSANGGMGTGGVTTGRGGTNESSDNPANTSVDRSGRAGTSASPGAASGPQSR